MELTLDRSDPAHQGALRASEARVRQSAIGVNFSDINVRRGGFYMARQETRIGMARPACMT